MKLKTFFSLLELFWNILKDIIILVLLAIFVFISKTIMLVLRLLNKIIKLTGIKKRLIE